ncbi:geranylgeranyl pyrophosphate synthase-like isoform X1 [Mya arenaria]|uniref:geranylgeranyl pyrophosphate synthase-like isoform X1 n=2 Tax=Mya arenaria TaxID=6604 RepID=UPI0022E6CA3E|nr:geranylgeranyl pyrophosphate synthase-like isoform X1 [Mya arenaria]XP_052772907.1 geranylgeranyl pyrophosphate synthase-like isoform X1 [Mya arenaria]XP_052772916.1 geranylgeranyl pyrophosphate synthase-like isoform X1 [Mya arenaria]XP_052772925.1 geranylgeranyl pyrophosphate synthase-like isoform X1 [Mya arenaria]XP_052772934.1 geranylgeranyl pyrophosphate synthase-like isoform X1 [Mya arenaria]XP_052772942.1 geranylgeranyl pyrophosphate synthase-like isoform X1 [Mya arenaria]XP_05278383
MMNVKDSTEKILLDPYLYICQIPGKQIRGKLALAFNHWLRIPDDKLQVIGEATQMLHNASLLIDDIEDNSNLRRGIPVAHNIYGTPHTINSANYVYFLGLQKVLALDHPDATRVFTEQMLELHRGQGMDIYWRDTVSCPSEQDYKTMVMRKTGGLFGLAVRLMQLFSDNKSDFKPLSDSLGLYFQIRDDYANLSSKEYEQNKSYCEDLTEGKFSFPLIHGISSDKGDNQILSILRQRTQDNDVKKYCVDLLWKKGSFEYTKTTLIEIEKEIYQQVEAFGGNSHLTSLMNELRKVYTS